MITANIMQRTFQLRIGSQIGTCFTMDVDGRQYLCTAKHCVKEFNGNRIEMLYKREWRYLEVNMVGFGSKNSDICIFASTQKVSPFHPISIGAGGLGISEDVHFLGFPVGYKVECPEFNHYYPVPLVKRAMVSAIEFSEDPFTILLDGHNNPGFSGGPVIYHKKGKHNDLCIVSIISGYRFWSEPVLDENDNETTFKHNANTGIIVSHSINHALDTIRDNPIGFPLEG